MAWLNHCLREVVDRDTIVINEYSFRQEYCPLETPGSLFGLSAAGGLGWGFPAALGAELASPDKLVLAVLGDGAYMFANPTACHYVSQTQILPTLTVLYNNALYGAVRRATLEMYCARRGSGGRRAPARRSAASGFRAHHCRARRPWRARRTSLKSARRAQRLRTRRAADRPERDLPRLTVMLPVPGRNRTHEQRQALRHVIIRHRSKAELHDHAANTDCIDLCQRLRHRRRRAVDQRVLDDQPRCRSRTRRRHGHDRHACSAETRLRMAVRCSCIASNAGITIRAASASVSATNTLRHTQHCSTSRATAASSKPSSRSVRRYRSIRCCVTSFDCTFIMKGRPCRAMFSIPSSLEAERITYGCGLV